MRSLYYPAPSLIARHGFQILSFLAVWFDLWQIVPVAKIAVGVVRIVSFAQTKMLPLTWRWPGATNRFAVESACSSRMSCVLEPLTWTPRGTPRLSVSTDRLVPNLPRSVGFLPVFSPTQSRLGHRSVPGWVVSELEIIVLAHERIRLPVLNILNHLL